MGRVVEERAAVRRELDVVQVVRRRRDPPSGQHYALSLITRKHFEEARSLLRKMIPVARRVFGASHDSTLRVLGWYAEALYKDPGATLDELREAVTTLEETEPTARRVLGGAHPITSVMEGDLREARAALRAREESDVCDAVAAMSA